MWAVAPVLGAFAWIGLASPAAADVIDGPCFGSGHWQDADFDEDSASHEPEDVILVPQSDTVEWFGNENDVELGGTGPEREINGEVELDLPIGTVTIDDWGPNDSVAYANAGEHDYKLPNVVVGIEMTLHGEHRENGEVVCSGSVIVKVDGDAFENPLAFVGLGFLGIGTVLLLLAGRPVFTKVGP